MFHKEFFPTPKNVLDQMAIDCYGKRCLEPSAGKGDIVNYLLRYGAESVEACEINNDLQKILITKCHILESDFFTLTKEQVSHIELIVMNPPFSNAAAHILHAWEIAPEGCEIISLLNWETIRNSYSRERTELTKIIEDYGDDSVELGDCFSTAERKTNVNVGLVRLFKPLINFKEDPNDFFFDLDYDPQRENGIVRYNEIEAIVNSYVSAMKCFDNIEGINEHMKIATENITGFGYGFVYNIQGSEVVYTKSDFSKKLQHKCWTLIFDKMNIGKYVTNSVMQDINEFIRSRKNYPFTLKNVYKMIEIIIGTRSQTMNRAIEDAVDKITKHTKENRYCVEGWKTNSGFMLNKKFIINYGINYTFGQFHVYNSQMTRLTDLIKALCYITGTDFDNITTPADIVNSNPQLETNTWYETTFFKFKVFMKKTIHLKFVKDQDWQELNRTYAKIKGEVLPESI